MQTRRDFLKLLAMASGAAGSAGLISESVQRAYAIEPAPGSSYLDAEHIVILMQENRSFDHAFGTLQGIRGFDDPRALRLANGNSVFVQTDAAGNSYAPWRLDIHDTRVTFMGSLPHSRESQVDAWNEGRHDGWLEAKRSGEHEYSKLPLTMGHYTREDIPFYYALADAFTICDQTYCSAMTSTSPNRSVFWTGTIREEQHAAAKAHIRNEQIDPGGMTWKTFPERLQEAGISWKSYQNELTRSGLSGEHDAWLSNYGDNVLECFSAYNVEAYSGFALAAQQVINELSEHAAKLEAQLSAQKDPEAIANIRKRLEAIQNETEAAKASLAACGEVRYKQLNDQQKALHHAAFVTNDGDPEYHALQSLPFENDGKTQTMMVPKGDVLHQFRKDVTESKLPAVSWLTAPERFSDHPSAPWYGAWYVSEVMDILTKNPEVWKKTIFILTYDENDGYFDHAPSFAAADPKRSETGGASAGIDTGLEYIYKEDELREGVEEKDARSGPIGMGFRVPMIVASPWSRGGWVNSQLFDHTSTLQFLEHFVESKYGKPVREENISAWRRAVAGDLTSVFRPFDSDGNSLDFVDRDKFVVSIEKARFKEIPSSYRRLTPDDIAKIDRTPSESDLLAHQEKGIRPACALPYELFADGNLSDDGLFFELRLTAGRTIHGRRSGGAPFNVYLRNIEDSHAKDSNAESSKLIAATYAVKPGDTLTPRIPMSHFSGDSYSIEVHGPNGFYRSFTGSSTAHPLRLQTSYKIHSTHPTGNMSVHLHNQSGVRMQAIIHDNSYKSPTISRSIGPDEDIAVVMHLERSHGWYDFTVKAEGSSAEARYAGRVEAGRSTFTDPRMGGVV